MKTYAVAPHQNRLGETVLMMGQNMFENSHRDLNYLFYPLLSEALWLTDVPALATVQSFYKQFTFPLLTAPDEMGLDRAPDKKESKG